MASPPFHSVKTILVLVDFSEVTVKALEWTKQMAAAFQSRVVLLHVASPDLEMAGRESAISHDPSARISRTLMAELEALRLELTQLGIDALAEQTHGVLVADAIAKESMRLNADLIVMGAHQHGALYHLIAGSISPKVLRKVHCPVLVVPA